MNLNYDYISYFSNCNLIDPNDNSESIDFLHLCATTNIIVSPGVISVPSSWGGWAGELGTLTFDMQDATNNYDDFDTLYNSGQNLLGRKSSLSMPDLLADIDAVNIASIMKSNNGESFSGALKEYYESGVSKTYTMFVDYYGGPDSFK